jgi:hypothetical protein
MNQIKSLEFHPKSNPSTSSGTESKIEIFLPFASFLSMVKGNETVV